MKEQVLSENIGNKSPDFRTIVNILKKPGSQTIVFDGATGTSFQNLELTADDFGGSNLDGCNENLVLTRPDVVEKVHEQFLEVGCDVIETNTFGASSIVLEEYGLKESAYKINKQAAKIAKKSADKYSTSLKPRFVAGSIGPTTKLPTLGHIDFDSLVEAYIEQVKGLIDGGVDLFLVETCQDVLQIKSALKAIRVVSRERNKKIPIMVSVTIENTGTMLIGTDISAVVTILEPFDIDILGLNCATGPEQMKEHIKYLSENSPFIISCIPNAGLPENIGGIAHYKLTPLELRMQLMHFIYDLGVKVIGGCCGTTPEHISKLVEISSEIQNKEDIIEKNSNYIHSSASIYSSTNYIQDNSFLIIGERLNASGSKKVRELLNEEDWDGLVSIARGQVKENAHILDVNVDFVGRDGVKDMRELVSRLVTNVNLPLMLDSTEYQKMESGLKVSGGKSILNSTNYEDGNERFFKVIDLAKRYGSGIVVGTIDEEGMARTSDHKFSIAKRAYKDITTEGIKSKEIFFDPLALPISTGIEEDRRNGLETINAIKLIKGEFPEVHIVLGISNISFGLSPSARTNLNSVYLNECYKQGLDTAIISPSKILPLSKIDNDSQRICKDLIYDKRKFKDGACIYDPLTELTRLFEGVSTRATKSSLTENTTLTVEEKLKQHIIDGEKIGLNDCLSDALNKYKPLEIINKFLLDGMKVVGELFGSGQMQLPFVLQSAETMKSAVSFLEPYIQKEGTQITAKAKFLIATVKGDVHDIGKNLVDIILTNNGYEVINLGIKQDITAIIDAQKRYKADCIAMSGLLVKSTAFMKDNLKAFNESGITVPVILGGAALTPKFVNKDCNEVYNGKLLYGKDAFTDLRFMDAYVDARKRNEWDDLEGFTNIQPEGISLADSGPISEVMNKHKNSNNIKDINISTKRSPLIQIEDRINSPFIGPKILSTSEICITDLINYLDKNALYASQWQFRRSKNQTKEEYKHFIANNAEPILDKWLTKIIEEKLISPKAVYGYFPCSRVNNEVHIFDHTDKKYLDKFIFPRQRSGAELCISDYFMDSTDGEIADLIPMQAVTMGEICSEYAQMLFKTDSYSDYLYFHGLTVQLAEALAEMVHAKIRIECGFKEEEPHTIREILAQKYRGCRYSFGYPACPNVSDSKKQLLWLNADEIGLSMDASEQLHPEQSTTAIICLHSEAKYFSA